MSTFKTALRMALAHPFYLLIYTVFISLMGVFIAASVSWNSSQLTEYKPYGRRRRHLRPRGRALQEQQRQGQRRLRVLYPGGV